MSLPIVFIIIVCMMSTFAFAGIIIMRKSNVPTHPSIDPQLQRMYKSGEDASPK